MYSNYEKPQTPKDALILALRLVVNAPTEQQANKVIAMLPELAAPLTEQEIDECKAIASAEAILDESI